MVDTSPTTHQLEDPPAAHVVKDPLATYLVVDPLSAHLVKPLEVGVLPDMFHVLPVG